MIVIGFWKDFLIYSSIGFVIIFLLSFVLITKSLEFETGMTMTTSGSTTDIVYNYETYQGDSRQIGIYVGTSSAFGFVLSLLEGKRRKKIEREAQDES